MLRTGPCVLLLAAIAALPAVEGPQPGLEPGAGGTVRAIDLSAPAVAPAPVAAIEFTWDNYQTLVVIGAGIGNRLPAWVVTSEVPPRGETALSLVSPLMVALGYPPLQGRQSVPAVAYRAVAYRDAQQRIHVDASTAVISGPQAGQWSPDSFRLLLPDTVESSDDNGSGHPGHILRVIDALADPVRYQSLRNSAEAAVGDGV